MKSFFEKPSKQRLTFLALLLAIHSIATQTATTTTSTTANNNATRIFPGKAKLKVLNYSTGKEPIDALAASNRTASAAPQATMNQYLPKALANWTSSFTHFMAIGGNIKALNPKLEDVLTTIPAANRNFTANAQFPMRAIITSVISILTNMKTQRSPIIYNNTIIMYEIPNYLKSKFQSYQENNEIVMSDQNKGNNLIELANEEALADVDYLLSQGKTASDQMNATLNANNFFTEKLPTIMNVSQNYAARMNQTLAALRAAKGSLEKEFDGIKKLITDSNARIFNVSVSLLKEVDAHVNQTEGFIKNFTDVVRARNPAASRSFEDAYTSQCNPSNDLLDLAIVTVREGQKALKMHVDNHKMNTKEYIDAAIVELDSKSDRIVSLIRSSVDWINTADAAHGNNIRAIKTNYFDTGSNKIKTVIMDGMASLNILVGQANTQAVALTSTLSTTATAADLPAKAKGLKEALDSTFFLVAELGNAIFSRSGLITKTVPLSQNTLVEEKMAQRALYNPFLTSPPAPCLRKVIPTLADNLANDVLDALDNCVGIVSIPTSPPFNPMYTDVILAETRGQKGLYFPMCYSIMAVANYEVQTVVPYMYSIYSFRENVNHLVLSRPPIVLTRVSFPGPIPAVKLEVNAKSLTGEIPFLTFYDEFNGNNNLVLANTIEATQSTVKVISMFSDNQQSQQLFLQSRKPVLSLTIIPDEKPFA